MTGPVRPPSRADQAWADLAAQLTPASSLARIDTVTARAITTITVLGVLLTGLGALAAGQFTHSSAARRLAATVATAALAVACDDECADAIPCGHRRPYRWAPG